MDSTTYTAPDTKTDQEPASPPPTPAKRRRPGRRKKIIKNSIATVIALAVVGAIVWFSYKVFFSEAPEYYLTGAIEVWPEIKNEVTGWGYLNPAESETVNITQPGNVLESYAWQGMMVREGDILAVIDSSAIDKKIEEYNKQIATLESEINDVNTQIEKEYEKLAKANAEQIAMRNAARMYAPFAGTVIGVPDLTLGEIVYKGTPVGRLRDDSQMKLTLYFSYGYENDIYIGQSCDVSIPSAMANIKGKVSAIEKVRRVGSDGSVTFLVEVIMDNPGSLASGSLATATLTTESGEMILPAETDRETDPDAGVLKCIREVVLTAESQGPLKELNVKNYYSYNEGDLLLVLDFEADTTIEEGYLSAIEGLQNGIVAKEEQITAILESIDYEKEKMAELTVTAPISGTITFTNLEPGMKITETAFATVNIAQLTTLMMEAWIGQNDVHNFSVGMEVDVLVWTQNGETPVKGSVTSIDTSAKQESSWAQYPVKISVDNSMGTVMDGSSASFSAKLGYSENAIVIPIQAVKNIGKGEYVFLKPKDGKAPENAVELEDDRVPPDFYVIPVKCGITNGRYIEITEGLLHEWEGWEVFTQKTDIAPSPSPSSNYEGDNEDPNYVAGYDDGYEAGLEAGQSDTGNTEGDLGGDDSGIDYYPEGDDGGFIIDGEGIIIDGDLTEGGIDALPEGEVGSDIEGSGEGNGENGYDDSSEDNDSAAPEANVTLPEAEDSVVVMPGVMR